MNFGHSSAVRFDVNHPGAPGIFWQKNQPKTEKRKFGYKSKGLRHEIRRPDDSELIAEVDRKKDEEKRKFNRDNKDFIQKNKGRYKPREQVPPPGSTHIGPGTVTLTQDQLAALLTSLGALNKGEGNADNPLKISFDTDTNKIEVQRYESDDGGSGDENADSDNNYGGGKSPALGIYDLLGDGDVQSKKGSRGDKEERKTKRKTKRYEKDSSNNRDESKEKEGESNSPLNTARSTLDDAKKEAGVAHISPTVPLKHMTVGERKRLQWAMERAEIEKEYDPWGRPGAGAPMGKTEETKIEKKSTSHSRENEVEIKAKHRQQREDLESDIERLRREIRDAEKQKEEEEQIIVNKILEEKRKKEYRTEKKYEKDNVRVEKGKRSEANENSERRQKKVRDNSQTRNEKDAGNEKVQIVFVTKKKGKNNKNAEDEKQEIRITLNSSGLHDGGDDDDDDGDDKGKESRKPDKKRKSRRDKDVDELPQESYKGTETPAENGGKEEEREKKGDPKSSNHKRASTDEEEETAHLSKKEIERRKWVAELNKQREEQRLKKQMERERDKAGVHDQWADRFVYHKSPRQISPRRGQMQSNPREEVPALGRAPESGTVHFEAPAAMRSSMVVGAGTLNDTRFDSKKEEEKRQWLEELDRQREEKRQQVAARKERERQEDGVWADRYPTDRQKISQFAQQQSNKSPRGAANPAAGGGGGGMGSQRVNSAPEPTVSNTNPTHTTPTLNLGVGDSQEQPTTFLRGQGAYVDPVTRKEQEEKRRLHLEYQAEIKRQIEEKERQKREERDRKAREDMEEERKFQLERDRVSRHEEAEKTKNRDREAQQQKHLATLKSAMEDAEERAKEEKNLRRIQHLQQRGHDVAQLKATYQAVTPRLKEYETTGIPGLGQSSTSPLPSEQVFIPAHQPTHTIQTGGRGTSPSPTRVQHQHYHQRPPMGQSYTKDPYVEDRVLTPSRNRNPSRPRDDPNSPRREFGTQTLELKDLQSILSSLPDDIQIEYKMKVEEALKEKQENKKPPAPTRKVHSKSADARNARPENNKMTAAAASSAAAIAAKREQQAEMMRERRVASKERPMKIGERPQWGQRKVKAAPKNSERDPFYEQKKEESEARKAKRERQLQYLQELNKERIPNLSPTRARAASPEANPGGVGGDRGRGGRDARGGGAARQGRRDRSNSKQRGGGSPNILTVAHDLESKHNAKTGAAANIGRSSSPPLPTVKHNTISRNNDNHYYNNENDPYFYTNNVLKNSHSDGRYEDLTVATAAPVHDGDFIPFTRTTEILDPARAGEPLAISRENSRMERARRAYHETRQPANRGKHLNVLQDRERETALRSQTMTMPSSNNPILNPHLVTDHPTGRQDQILQQLSSLKQVSHQ